MSQDLHKLVFLLLVIVVAGCGRTPSGAENGEAQAPEKLLTYTSTQYSVERPARWEVEEGDALVYFKTPLENDSDTLQENVIVYVAPLASPDQDLVHLVQDSLEIIMKTVPGFAIIEHRETALGEIPAYQIQYTVGEEGAQTNYLQVFAVANGNSYILTYTAPAETFDAYLPEAEAIINSYRIK